MSNPIPNLWRKWQYAICIGWIIVSAIILFKPDYQRQIQHYGHGELYFPDKWDYSIFLVLIYSILPISYLWASFIAWFRQHFILQWLAILAVYLLLCIMAIIGAMHNSSQAYFYWVFAILIGTIVHILIVPWIWWWINQSLQPKID